MYLFICLLFIYFAFVYVWVCVHAHTDTYIRTQFTRVWLFPFIMWGLGIELRLSVMEAIPDSCWAIWLHYSRILERNYPVVVSFSDCLTWVCIYAPIQAASLLWHKDLKKEPALPELKRVFFSHLSAPLFKLARLPHAGLGFLLAVLPLIYFPKQGTQIGWKLYLGRIWERKGMKVTFLAQLLLRATESWQRSKWNSEYSCKCACMCNRVCRSSYECMCNLAGSVNMCARRALHRSVVWVCCSFKKVWKDGPR